MHKELARAIRCVGEALGSLSKAVVNLIAVVVGGEHCHPQFTIEGGDFMYIVKADHAPEPFTLSPVVVKDSEGHVIPGATVHTDVVSDNPTAVGVSLLPDFSGGVLTFGSPNPDGTPAQATVTATYRHPDAQGTVVGMRTAVFVIPPGDPAAFSGGDIQIPGLTEEPEVPPEG